MRPILLPWLLAIAGCSSGGGGESARRPAADDAPSKTRTAEPAKAPAAVRWSGTFEGRTEPTPAPMPSRNVAPNTPPPDAGPNAPSWNGNGTIAFEQTDENVTGTIEGGGLSCKLGGSLVSGKLRGWLASEGAVGSRRMGRIEGATEGDAVRGSWRLSSSGGVEVRAGTFEARRAP